MSVLHTPVLVEEVIEWLRIRPEGTYVDATAGTGGHALEIARRLTTGTAGGDGSRPAGAGNRAGAAEAGLRQQVILVHAEFSKIGEVARELALPPVDGVLADLGVSSLELDSPERGFSFRSAGPLDMRMNAESTLSREGETLTAAEIVNHWPEKELADLLYQKAEERDSRRIARAIVRARPIRDTEHLATVVAGARKVRGRQKLHPATKTFLALRIAVNREVEELGQFLSRAPATLIPEGDGSSSVTTRSKIVWSSRAFQALAREGSFRVLTKKVIQPRRRRDPKQSRGRAARRCAWRKRIDPAAAGGAGA